MSDASDMHGDLRAAVQMLAADNARMCDILIAADKLAAAADHAARVRWAPKELVEAIEAFKIVRTGQ